jgi:endogenous inhibitor of DNA gyrase (YacG/DUF329 family)
MSESAWASHCARCGKSVDEDENKTIDLEPAILRWEPVSEGTDDDPTGVICPTCQGLTYDWFSALDDDEEGEDES